jgi:hypothetical protein
MSVLGERRSRAVCFQLRILLVPRRPTSAMKYDGHLWRRRVVIRARQTVDRSPCSRRRYGRVHIKLIQCAGSRTTRVVQEEL